MSKTNLVRMRLICPRMGKTLFNLKVLTYGDFKTETSGISN